MKKYFKKRKWLGFGAVVIVAGLLFGGALIYEDGQGTTNAKNISFVGQFKDSGTHVWVRASGKKINKDDSVDSIFVLSDGKLRVYKIFDNNINLGKLSSMSDATTIKLAKKQDKKYATTGAIAEIKSYLNGKGQVGVESDFDNLAKNTADGKIELCYRYQAFDKTNEVTSAPQVEQATIMGIYPNEGIATAANQKNPVSILSIDLTSLGHQAVTSKNGGKDNNFASALIKHIEQSTYQAPAPQKIKVESTANRAKNSITSQDITYTAINLFKTSNAEANVYNFANQHKSDFIKLLTLQSSQPNLDNNDTAIKTASENQANENHLAGNKLYQQLLAGQYAKLTQNVYGYYKYNKTFTLLNPTSQMIHKTKYIGYVTDENGNYLLTKAQNKRQKAVLNN